MKKLILLIFIIILFSCNNKNSNVDQNTVINNYDENLVNNDDNIERIELMQNFKPTHIISSSSYVRAYSEPDEKTKNTISLSEGQLVELIEKKIINYDDGKEIIWAKIVISSGHIGWCFYDLLLEIDQNLIGLPMNKISNPVLIFTNVNNEKIDLILEGEYGDFNYYYNNNKVSISYFKKEINFDDHFNYYNMYWKEKILAMEISIANHFNVFPNYNFNQNSRKNVKNNFVFVDSFVFSEYELENQQLRRLIFFTTEDYIILVNIMIPIYGDEQEKYISYKIINKVINEAPEYFKIRIGGEIYDYNEDNIKHVLKRFELKELNYNGNIIWDYPNKKIEQFGNDLLLGSNLSNTATEWYNETEKILNGIFIEYDIK